MCLNKIYNKVCIGINLSDALPIQNCIKQGDVLLPQLLNFDLQYAIRKVQENEEGMGLNGIYQLLIYGDNGSILG